MKKLAFATLVALVAAPVASSWAAPETYIVEPNHTFPRFSYQHLGYSTQLSRFDKTTGKVVLDKEARTASVDMSIDLTSVSTGSAVFNQHIQGPDYLDTANHPMATFKSTAVKFDGDKPVSIDGNLTIKGVTKPVTLTVSGYQNKPHPMMKKDAIGADASVVVKRSDFNMGKNVPYVGDEVTISIAIEALKE